MMTDFVADVAGIRQDECERLMALPPDEVYQDPAYRALVAGLEMNRLDHTLDHARAAYETCLEDIKERHGLAGSVMSGHTLCNWVMGYLRMPEKMGAMLNQHARIPTETITAVVPELVAALDQLTEEQGRREWQRALVIFTLPMMAGNLMAGSLSG